ncbi:MAG: CoA-binding protein [Chloroflexi bacterium]|nr:CoA-binding protein [Chloroflexota bacterium]MBI3741235.1 CoA-binding protein [Chloroflexota bacterium]
MNDIQIKKILQSIKTIAVVGMSEEASKPSHEIPQYLRAHGYKIIPVHPRASTIDGLGAYPDLISIPEKIDAVQIFRPAAETPQIVEQAILIDAQVVWMQEGIVNHDAARRAQQAGVQVVMDRCMRVEHIRLIGA